jgi:hypothetical protein
LCIKSEDASQKEQRSSDAITSCIRDTRLSSLTSILGGALLGKTPLFTTVFVNGSIDESFEAACNPMVNNHMRLLRIHWCYLRENSRVGIGFDLGTQTLRIELCIWMCRRWHLHRSDANRDVVRAEEELIAFVELEFTT